MTRDHYVPVERIGTFVVPSDTEAHRADGEACVHGICGRYDPELARREGAWGARVGQEYSYLSRDLEPVRTVLDIGHNVGAYTVWACREWWPSSVRVVHAYDPNPGCAEYMAINLDLVPRGIIVHIHTVAVTTEARPVLHLDERWGCSHTSPGMTERRPVGDPVAVVGLHPALLPRAHAVKIDAEGVEGEILSNYPHWYGVLVLQVEWHSHANRELLFEVARQHGLALKKNDCGADSQGVACFVRET